MWKARRVATTVRLASQTLGEGGMTVQRATTTACLASQTLGERDSFYDSFFANDLEGIRLVKKLPLIPSQSAS